MVAIRAAMPADTAAILQLVRDLAAYEREPDAVKATADDLHEALFGPQPVAEAVLAETGGVIIGMALFFVSFSTWTGKPGLYLEDLFVSPEARGAGAGKALLVHLARLAAARDYARFEWAVLDWNEPAIGFYRALGAKPMDDWTTMRLDGEALQALANS